MRKIQKLAKFAAVLAAAALIFCSNEGGDNSVNLARGKSGADIEVTLGDGPLPHKLMVELSANGQDTLYDTVLVTGHKANCRFLDIAPFKEWKVTAHTVDMNDSTVQSGSNTFTPQPNQMSYVYMELQSKYFSMRAYFSRVQSNMTRAEILIDDSRLFATDISDNSSDTAEVDVNYVPLKNQYRVTGRVYGIHNGSEVLLFSGDTTVTVPWYDDRAAVFTLDFRPSGYNQNGPSTMTVLLEPEGGNTEAGRIGQPIYYNGHYYDAVTLDREITWDAAKQMASALSYRGMQGHLATITSSGENQFVWHYLAAQSGVNALFIGGYQDPEPNLRDTTTRNVNWHWITGEAWSYTNWSPGEPNNFVKDRDEIWLMMWVYSGKWNDQITYLNGFVVEYE